jgi:endothelin-converting enzyme/putative endopeptidase
MIRLIEKAMADDIRQSPWMGDKTKARAIEKLAAVAHKVGYPDKWRDYATLTISRTDALGNLERMGDFEFRRQIAKMGRPLDRGEWLFTPTMDNCYYDSQLNDINFAAGYLQRPQYDPKSDAAAAFGALGKVIGHELTHGFDDDGRRYDAHGNMADWWTEADDKAFQARADGFVDQYSRYVYVKNPKDPSQDVKLNGRLTLGENIADNGGTRLAYAAFLDAVRAETPRVVDGLDDKQRLFASAAQADCMEQTDELARQWAKFEPHPIGKFRVNGVVSNMPEFGEAFSCKVGSPMRPEKVNRVW